MKFIELVRAVVANGVTLSKTVLRVGGKAVRLNVRVVITDDVG